jgi:hypothetical protein
MPGIVPGCHVDSPSARSVAVNGVLQNSKDCFVLGSLPGPGFAASLVLGSIQNRGAARRDAPNFRMKRPFVDFRDAPQPDYCV